MRTWSEACSVEPLMRKRNSFAGAVVPWYPVKLPLSYQGGKPGFLRGEGHTLAMNSGAIRFTCDRDLPPNLIVHVVILWPAKLDDGVSLCLSASGKIQT